MIPITRKELYLNKIVGNNEYETPEKPISEEEFFFAEILGEAVQAPEPLTRYQMYLARIAGRNIEIPYPETRLEYFLAKAAGMNVSIPTPITREEMFWADYALSVEKELSGIPPLIYKAKKADTLTDYRIYGAEGNVGNLRPSLVAATDFTNGYHVATDGTISEHGRRVATLTPIDVSAINTIYVNSGINTLSNPVIIYSLFSDDTFIERSLVNGIEIVINTEGANKLYLSFGGESKVTTANLNNVYVMDNDKMYVIPVTVSNGTDTQTIPIYIPEQIRKVGDEAEYISYTDHKLHRVGAEDIDVTLPALPILSGANTLTVGTEVQPSKVYLKGKIEEIPTRTVSYYSQDGSTLLGTETVESGGNASGLQDTPTKPDTEQYTYTFVGWSNTTNATTAMSGILNNITADKSVYAAFSETEKTFTVTFYNGAELIYTAQNVSYNGTAVYSGTTPTKAETSEYTYTFAGWNTNSSASTADADALTNVTADRTVYAIFTAVSKGYTVYFYNGETLLETVTGVPSGGTATYTGATPTSSQAGYIFSGWSPSNTNIMADTSCYAQFVDEDMYESISDAWSEIIANVSNGTYSTKYHIGDTKKIDLGTEGEVIMQIVGIDADDLADNSGKAPITWISKQLLKTNHRMSPLSQSDTSGAGTLGGWEACEMRSYLINTIKPLLPLEVRNALKTVKKYSRIYNTSDETAVNNVVSNDDIWIPSAYEMNFTGYETSGVTYSIAFPDNASRIKHKVGGSAMWWSLRSADGADRFRFVGYSGKDYGVGASNLGGVAVGFVI